MRRDSSKRPGKPRGRSPMPVFDTGQTVHDLDADRGGRIVDVAQQFSHPNADPVHNYLVRWDDGHESTFRPTAGTVHTIHPPKDG